MWCQIVIVIFYVRCDRTCCWCANSTPYCVADCCGIQCIRDSLTYIRVVPWLFLAVECHKSSLVVYLTDQLKIAVVFYTADIVGRNIKCHIYTAALQFDSTVGCFSDDTECDLGQCRFFSKVIIITFQFDSVILCPAYELEWAGTDWVASEVIAFCFYNSFWNNAGTCIGKTCDETCILLLKFKRYCVIIRYFKAVRIDVSKDVSYCCTGLCTLQ